METSFPKPSLMIMEFNRGFEKLLNDNGQKWSFPKSGLTVMEFNGVFEKLLNNNGQKQSFPDIWLKDKII